jgi:hypothetical protein
MGNNKIEWGTPTTIHQALSLSVDLADGANVLGGAIDPSGYIYSSYELIFATVAAPTKNEVVELYLLPALDGTNYADGDASTDPSLSTFVGNFTTRATTAEQRAVILNKVTTPHNFKPLLKNELGAIIHNASGTLNVTFHNEQVVT